MTTVIFIYMIDITLYKVIMDSSCKKFLFGRLNDVFRTIFGNTSVGVSIKENV